MPMVAARLMSLAIASASPWMLPRCSRSYDSAVASALRTTERTCDENHASMPKFTVSVANTATRMVGASATTVNSPDSRRCSRAPAERARRAAIIRAMVRMISAARIRI